MNKIITIGRLQLTINWRVALVVTVLILLLINLGIWQLGRATEKRAANAASIAKESAAPVLLKNLIDPLQNIPANGLKVKLRGEYIQQKHLLVENKSFMGRPGIEVISVFKLADRNYYVLVSRGWSEHDTKESFEVADGTVEIIATIAVPDRKPFLNPVNLKGEMWPIRLHHFDMRSVEGLFKDPLFPYVLRLETEQTGLLTRHWPKKYLNPENNISYALQWFGMALLALVITLIKSSNILALWQNKNR